MIRSLISMMLSCFHSATCKLRTSLSELYKPSHSSRTILPCVHPHWGSLRWKQPAVSAATKKTKKIRLTVPLYRYNSQYTTLQDSLYNKYALSVLPGRVPSKHGDNKDNRTTDNKLAENSEIHLGVVRRLLSFQVVETLVPWLYCVYPPITVSNLSNW